LPEAKDVEIAVLCHQFGRRPVILGGITLLLAACATAGTAGHDTARLSVGLVLLGMGWSATMVAGSTLLSESVGWPTSHRCRAWRTSSWVWRRRRRVH